MSVKVMRQNLLKVPLRAFDDSVDGIATMTFEQMTAFEVKSKVSIFFYLMVHCVLKGPDVPLGGLGNTHGSLRRLLLHITESGLQMQFSKDIDLVGSEHECIFSNRLQWCIETDTILQAELDRFSNVLASIFGEYNRLQVNHITDLDTWAPNTDNMAIHWVAVTPLCYNAMHRSEDAYGQGLVSDAVDTTPPDPDDAYNESHYTEADSRKALKRLAERIQSTKYFAGEESSTVPIVKDVNYMMISTCKLFYGKKSKKLFDMLDNADFVLIFELLYLKIYHYTKKGSNQHSLIFVHGHVSNMLQSRLHDQAPITSANLVSSSKTATVLHFLQAVYKSFGSDNPTTTFKTNKSMAGNNLFAYSAYGYSIKNGHQTSQNGVLIGKNILALLHGVNHFQDGYHRLPAGPLNKWEKTRNERDAGNNAERDGVISRRIVNIASSAMNESEVDCALRNIVEMLVTSNITGKKRRRDNILNLISTNESLASDIKTRLINIVNTLMPLRQRQGIKLKKWTKTEDIAIKTLILDGKIVKWGKWVSMSKLLKDNNNIDRSTGELKSHMKNSKFGKEMKTLFDETNRNAEMRASVSKKKKRKRSDDSDDSGTLRLKGAPSS